MIRFIEVTRFCATKVDTLGGEKESVESPDPRKLPVNQTSHGAAVHRAPRPYHRALVVIAVSP